MTRKISVLALLISFLFISCWNDVESYTLGRGMYYTIEANVNEATIDKLENRYNVTLAETQGIATVAPAQMISLFNGMATILALAEVKNHYGLLGDMSFLLNGAGAKYAESGELINVRPIPRGMLVAFSTGWKNSKADMASRK